MSFPNAIICDGSTAPYGTADTSQKHPLGQRMILEDGRVFVYAKAGGTLCCGQGACNALGQHVGWVLLAEDAEAGAKTVVLPVSSSMGAAGNGEIAEDELVGGYFVMFDASDTTDNMNTPTRRIVANTAVAAGGADMTLTLDAGIPLALIGGTDSGECMASPYLNVQTIVGVDDEYSSVVGVPAVAATVGQYLWLQTWGPIWISPQGEVSTGRNDRQVVFRADGSVDQHDDTDVEVCKAQHAGFVLANAASGGAPTSGQGAAFIMLQISI